MRKRPVTMQDTPLKGTPKGIRVLLSLRAVSVDDGTKIEDGLVYPEPIGVIGWDNPSQVPYRRLIEVIVMKEFERRKNV